MYPEAGEAGRPVGPVEDMAEALPRMVSRTRIGIRGNMSDLLTSFKDWFSLTGDSRFLIQVVIFGPYFYACYRGLVYARRVYLGHERFRGRWYEPDELRRLKQEISDRFRYGAAMGCTSSNR